MIRLVYEDDEIAAIRQKIKTLNTQQLSVLEELMRRERKQRQKQVYRQWLDILNQYMKKPETLHVIDE